MAGRIGRLDDGSFKGLLPVGDFSVSSGRRCALSVLICDDDRLVIDDDDVVIVGCCMSIRIASELALDDAVVLLLSLYVDCVYDESLSSNTGID